MNIHSRHQRCQCGLHSAAGHQLFVHSGLVALLLLLSCIIGGGRIAVWRPAAHTATQYALFSSLMTLPAKFISGFSGVIVDSYGYFNFFLFAASLGLPAIILAFIIYWHDQAVKSVS